jgi:hypothetical protein
MLVLLPAYQAGLTWLAPGSEAAQMGFSHAFYGATRHAITVGFISLMIVGVSAKVVPTLNGVDPKSLSPLWGPLVLINLGCLLRVTGQTMTDFTTAAFPVAGLSGLLEVSGLAMWGAHLTLIMTGRARVRRVISFANVVPLENRDIQPTDTVAAVLDHEPRLLETFLSGGFALLANPYARRTFARVVTLRQACMRMGVEERPFVAELNRARHRLRSLELPLIPPQGASESSRAIIH